MASEDLMDLGELIGVLYATFAPYSDPGSSFCSLCYTPAEARRITTSCVSALSPDDARKLLWESWDHWENADIYRHYLPRILAILGPPDLEEDLYPAHVCETLDFMGFHNWLPSEQNAVLSYLEAVGPCCNHDDDDRKIWRAALDRLRAA